VGAHCFRGRLSSQALPRRVIDKTHAQVRIGDVLTLPLPGGVRVVQITRLPLRRGPAPEAQATYVEIPPQRGEDDAATADRGGKD